MKPVLLVLLLLGQSATDPLPGDPTPPPAAPAPTPPPPIEVTVRLGPKAPTGAADAGGPEPAAGGVVFASTDDKGSRPLEVRLAEPLTLELMAVSDRDTELFLPLIPTLGSFELVSPEAGLERVEGTTKTVTRRWTVLPVRVGIEKVPPLEVSYRTPAGDEGTVPSPPLRVFVRGHLENEADPALGAPPAPVDITTTNWLLFWVLTVAGALVLALLVGWVLVMALRHRFDALRPKPPPRPANELALERLDRIESQPDEALDGGRRVAETVDTLREYLGRRYGIDALEMTSSELERALPSLDLRGVRPETIAALLAEADLVKFARLVPPAEVARQPAAVVRTIVEATWVAEERPDEDLPARAEPASLRQRLYAGLIDGLVAGSLGLLTLLGLFVAGAPGWGWLGLVVIGLALLLRDLDGRSPGKRVLRIVAVRRDATQTDPGFGRLVKRNALLALWPLTLPIEWLVLRSHPLSLRLGDMLAETEVVRDLGRVHRRPLVPWRRRGEPRLPVASRRSPAASHGPDDRIGAAPQAPPALGGPSASAHRWMDRNDGAEALVRPEAAAVQPAGARPPRQEARP